MDGWWAGCGDSSRLCSDTAVMELIDHLYGCLLALAYSKRPTPRLCVTAAITQPICDDPPSPIDFNLATVLTLAAGFTSTALQRSARPASLCCIEMYRRVRRLRWSDIFQFSLFLSCSSFRFSIWIKGHNQSMIIFAGLSPCPLRVTQGHNPNLSRVLRVITLWD